MWTIILVVRHDAERVAATPTAELVSAVRTQGETASTVVGGGKSAATCLILGQVVTVQSTNIISEKSMGNNNTSYTRPLFGSSPVTKVNPSKNELPW